MATPNEESAAMKAAPKEKTQPSAKAEPTASAATGETEQLIFTLRSGTGEVLKIEKVNATGQRSEIPDGEIAGLAGKESLHEIEAALDDAFEVGISRLLDPGDDDEAPEEKETAEEMELRKLLLGLIIGQAVRRRMRRRIVQRLILSRTLSR